MSSDPSPSPACPEPDSRRNLIWFDGSAGAAVGVFMLLLAPWLEGLYELPLGFIYFVGGANLTYGIYSLTLASRKRRPMRFVQILAVANMVWGVLCFYWFFQYLGEAGFLGLGHLFLEGVFVGGLGMVEWRWRELLTIP